jgi:hypothetical protein
MKGDIKETMGTFLNRSINTPIVPRKGSQKNQRTHEYKRITNASNVLMNGSNYETRTGHKLDKQDTEGLMDSKHTKRLLDLGGECLMNQPMQVREDQEPYGSV